MATDDAAAGDPTAFTRFDLLAPSVHGLALGVTPATRVARQATTDSSRTCADRVAVYYRRHRCLID